MAIPGNLTGQALYNFIGGRRAYNSQRQWKALGRRYKLLFVWAQNPHMRKADLARYFGVSRSTITRDVQALKRDGEEMRRPDCPLCAGDGSIDTGPGAATSIEFVSDTKRNFSHLFR